MNIPIASCWESRLHHREAGSSAPPQDKDGRGYEREPIIASTCLRLFVPMRQGPSELQNVHRASAIGEQPSETASRNGPVIAPRAAMCTGACGVEGQSGGGSLSMVAARLSNHLLQYQHAKSQSATAHLEKIIIRNVIWQCIVAINSSLSFHNSVLIHTHGGIIPLTTPHYAAAKPKFLRVQRPVYNGSVAFSSRSLPCQVPIIAYLARKFFLPTVNGT